MPGTEQPEPAGIKWPLTKPPVPMRPKGSAIRSMAPVPLHSRQCIFTEAHTQRSHTSGSRTDHAFACPLKAARGTPALTSRASPETRLNSRLLGVVPGRGHRARPLRWVGPSEGADRLRLAGLRNVACETTDQERDVDCLWVASGSILVPWNETAYAVAAGPGVTEACRRPRSYRRSSMVEKQSAEGVDLHRRQPQSRGSRCWRGKRRKTCANSTHRHWHISTVLACSLSRCLR